MTVDYIENKGNVKTEMEIDVIVNDKDNTTAKMNINTNKLIIIRSKTMAFDI